MVKPASLGSSVGITLAHDAAELPAGARRGLPLRPGRLAEALPAGARDLEVSVIGNDHARLELYGPGEILAGHEFYDYAAKYTPGPVRDRRSGPRSRRRCGRSILKIARDAYRAIGAEGFARVDFLVRGDAGLPVRDQHDPGLHPDQPLPDDAGRRRLHVRATSAPGSSISRSSATPAASRAA